MHTNVLLPQFAFIRAYSWFHLSGLVDLLNHLKRQDDDISAAP
jgi:hypothetical protein